MLEPTKPSEADMAVDLEAVLLGDFGSIENVSMTIILPLSYQEWIKSICRRARYAEHRPGQAMLDRLAKLEAVAEHAWHDEKCGQYVTTGPEDLLCTCGYEKARTALAVLEKP